MENPCTGIVYMIEYKSYIPKKESHKYVPLRIRPDVSGNYICPQQGEKLCPLHRCGRTHGLFQASVSRAVSTLKKDGYIIMGEDGGLQLTEKGLEVAQAMYERHTVLTKLLMGLGVEESLAAEDACRMEHVLSEESFAAIKAHMEMYAK